MNVLDIKEKINNSGFHQWEVAEKLNVSEFTLSRWLRRPGNLCDAKVNNIEKAINELKINRREEVS